MSNYRPTQNPTNAWRLMRAQSRCVIGDATDAEYQTVKELHAAIDAHPVSAWGIRGRIAGASYCKARAAGLRPYAANVTACWDLLAALDKLAASRSC